MDGEWPVYVSYSWETEGREPLVDKLQKDARNFPRLRLTLDINKCQPGDSISAFVKKVGTAPRLILILSEPYFGSEYTLREFAIALKHGGLNTRVRVVLVGDFRLDRCLDDRKAEIQKFIDDKGIGLSLSDYDTKLFDLGDSLVSVPNANKDTDFSAVLQKILESYQQFPNPELDNEERLINQRISELRYFQEQVRGLFARSKTLQPLRDNMQRFAAGSGVEIHLGAPALVCNIGIGDTQQRVLNKVLVPAISETLESARQAGKITMELLDNLVEIVGWSAATLVNDLWIEEYGVSLCDMGSPGHIEIGLRHPHLIELMVARAHRRSAKVVRQGRRSIASGSGVVLDGPESAQNTLTFVFSELAKRFMPDEEINEGLTDVPTDYWEELDARISIRREIENIFIAFRMPQNWGPNLRAELSRKLQCLPQIWVRSPDGGHPVLVLSEARVWAVLGELIAKIEGCRAYVKKDRQD
jgi:hypothetical protein